MIYWLGAIQIIRNTLEGVDKVSHKLFLLLKTLILMLLEIKSHAWEHDMHDMEKWYVTYVMGGGSE